MKQHKRSLGFTLIELLVVIAVIGILAAMMFPVFAAAREKARQAACLSNVKQMGLAAMMYADDNDETFPPYEYPYPGSAQYWFGYRNADGTFDANRGLLMPYIKTQMLQKCPSFSAHAYLGNSTGYGYNYCYVGGDSAVTYNFDLNYWPGHPANQASLQHSSTTIMFADAEIYYNPQTFALTPGEAWETPAITPPSFGGTGAWADVGYRHHNMANIVFCDGHARSLAARYGRE